MRKGKSFNLHGSVNHIETMESRTMLSVAAPAIFAGTFHFHAFGFDAAPHAHFASPAAEAAHADFAQREVIVAGSLDNGYSDTPVLIGIWSQTGPRPDFAHPDNDNFDGGYPVATYHLVQFSNWPVNPPSQDRQPDSDEASDHEVATPARVSEASVASVTGQVIPKAVRQVVAAGTSQLLNSTGIQTAAPVVQVRTGTTFASAAVFVTQSPIQAARIVTTYLSSLEQSSAATSVVKSLAADVKAVLALPAIALRQTSMIALTAVPEVISSPAAYGFARLTSPFTLVADSIGSFIQASAMIPLGTPRTTAAAHRAWTITATVIAADVMLLTYYHQKRRKAQAALAVETAMA